MADLSHPQCTTCRKAVTTLEGRINSFIQATGLVIDTMHFHCAVCGWRGEVRLNDVTVDPLRSAH